MYVNVKLSNIDNESIFVQWISISILNYDLKPYEQRTDVHIITLVQDICIYATVYAETILIGTFSNTRKTNL